MAQEQATETQRAIDADAQTLMGDYTTQFYGDLLTQARIKAINKRERIQAVHVNEAWLDVRNIRPKRFRGLREFLIFLGGAFSSPLIETLLINPSGAVPALQALLGVTGLIVALLAFFVLPD
jgi:antibiotic biosynthesis monooxygenase (ABM) superfamily enzyme